MLPGWSLEASVAVLPVYTCKLVRHIHILHTYIVCVCMYVLCSARINTPL